MKKTWLSIVSILTWIAILWWNFSFALELAEKKEIFDGKIVSATNAFVPKEEDTWKLQEMINLRENNLLRAPWKLISNTRNATMLFPLSNDSSTDVVYKSDNYMFEDTYYNLYVTKNQSGEYFLNYASFNLKTSEKFFKQQKLYNKNFFSTRLKMLKNNFIYIEYVEDSNRNEENDSIIIYNKNTHHQMGIKGKKKWTLENEFINLRASLGYDMCEKYENKFYQDYEKKNNIKTDLRGLSGDGFSWEHCRTNNEYWQKKSIEEVNKQAQKENDKTKNNSYTYQSSDKRNSEKSPWFSKKIDNLAEGETAMNDLGSYNGYQIFNDLDKSLIMPGVDLKNLNLHVETQGDTFYFFGENLKIEWYPHEYVITLDLNGWNMWFKKIKNSKGEPFFYHYNNGQEQGNSSVYPNSDNGEYILAFTKSSRINQDTNLEIISINPSFIAKSLFTTSVKQQSDIWLNTLIENTDTFQRNSYKDKAPMMFVRKELNGSKTYFWSFVKNERSKTLIVYNNRLNKIFEYKDIISVNIDSDYNGYIIVVEKKINNQVKKFIYKLNIDNASNNIIYETMNGYKMTPLRRIQETQEDNFMIEGDNKLYFSDKGLVNVEKNDKISVSPNWFFYTRYQFNTVTGTNFLSINDKNVVPLVAKKLKVKGKEVKSFTNTYISDNGYLLTQVSVEKVKKVIENKVTKEKVINEVYQMILNDKEVLWIKNFTEEEKKDLSFYKGFLFADNNQFFFINMKNNILEVIDTVEQKATSYKLPAKVINKIKSLSDGKIITPKDYLSKEQLSSQTLIFSKWNDIYIINSEFMTVINTTKAVYYHFNNISQAFFENNDFYIVGEYRGNDKVNVSVFRNKDLLLSGLNDIKDISITPFKNYLIIDVVKDNNRIIYVEKSFVDFDKTVLLKKYLDNHKVSFKRANAMASTTLIDSIYETFYMNFLNIKDKKELFKAVDYFITSLDNIQK